MEHRPLLRGSANEDITKYNGRSYVFIPPIISVFLKTVDYVSGVQSHRIIVVDDDDAVRSIIAELTRETVPSATVMSYASSLQVLQEISTGSIDLLITNCHMPDMDGPTLIRTLRESRTSIPIIMVSGSEEARSLAEDVGVDRFVAKHLLHAELPGAIESLLAE